MSRLISRQGILAHGWGVGAGLGRLAGGLQVRRGRRREYQDDDDVLVEVKQVHNPVCSTLRYSLTHLSSNFSKDIAYKSN